MALKPGFHVAGFSYFYVNLSFYFSSSRAHVLCLRVLRPVLGTSDSVNYLTIDIP